MTLTALRRKLKSPGYVRVYTMIVEGLDGIYVEVKKVDLLYQLRDLPGETEMEETSLYFS